MKVARPALPDLDSSQTAQPHIFTSAEVLSHTAHSRLATNLSTVDASNARNHANGFFAFLSSLMCSPVFIM